MSKTLGPAFPKLLFIYNADSGFFSKLTDFAHKAISPATYSCSLCALTHGTFTMKQEWADYIRSLPLEAEFIYRDAWKAGAERMVYPLVALQTAENEVEVLLDAKELNALKSLQELRQALEAALQRHTAS
ncbi:hypothetical protein [Pontibacter russatus]|uniref:hypothetical protein n=1 Tax=Pontibacter russatus TaxID=2694929 RepID=UPI00137B837D|nr:hypothetical protein [Pontibacter russatus]